VKWKNIMFDLNEKISEWRRQMLDAGINTPVPLDELENHLREDVERQIDSGSDPLKAFEIAVRWNDHSVNFPSGACSGLGVS
jgi:hypothetical protein